MTLIGASDLGAACIDDHGNGLTVAKSHFLGCYDCIDSEGDDTTVRYNVFRHCADDVAEIDGNNAIFSGNDVAIAEYGPEITGDNCEVVNNSMVEIYDAVFYINGADAYVAYNTMRAGYDDGIEISGDRGV